MTKTLREWLILLGTTSLFAVAIAVAPVQLDFASGTLGKAVAHAQDANTGTDAGGNDDGADDGPGGEPGEGGEN